MPWFKVDDGFYSHPKVLTIPREARAAAIGTWTLCGTWAAKHEQDGVIPKHIVEEVGGSTVGADALVRAKLWRRRAGGYVFHDWQTYQPTKAELDERRAAEAKRKAEYRARKSRQDDGDVPAGQGRTDGGTEAVSQPSRPDPTRPDPSIEVLEGGGTKSSGPFCPRHPHGTEKPCLACKRARLEWEELDALAARERDRTPTPPKLLRPEECEHTRAAGGYCPDCLGRVAS